jgi:hypothetical protein
MNIPDYSDQVGAAVASFWEVRRTQAERSRDLGVLNPGLRSEVTGGKHMNALQLLLLNVITDAGVPPHLMEIRKRPVPGYFRRDKSWDVVVTVGGRVLAIVELKSITGTNPGQNFNNRTDEALGQAIDVWKAVERRIIDSPLRPWLGYFMLIEDNPEWNRRGRGARKPVWPADPAFEGTSPAERAAIFFDRMVRERLLDSACLILASRTDADVRFLSETLSFQSFAASIVGRCLQFRAINRDLAWS